MSLPLAPDRAEEDARRVLSRMAKMYNMCRAIGVITNKVLLRIFAYLICLRLKAGAQYMASLNRAR